MSSADDPDDEEPAGQTSQRVDRWLWYVRVAKSRTLAAGLVTEGRVRLNSTKTTKPSQSVKPGDVLTITVGHRIRILQVAALGVRRGPAPEAQLLYVDLSPPPPPKTPEVDVPGKAQRDFGSGRPTKRDRRQIDRLMGEEC